MVKYISKLPNVGTTIFATMSNLATKEGAINLGQGYPNFDCPEELRAMIVHYLNNGKNQYAPMIGLPVLLDRLAEKMNTIYGCDLVGNKEITITAGATQALFSAITAFVHPGDEVILLEPCYDSYRPSVESAGGVPVAYELEAPAFKVDWEEVSSLISDKTRMIIINTPHNPIGKTLKKEDMLALESITRNTDIIVLSDEVYEHLIYDGQAHQSVLRFEELRKRSLAVYSFGKTFHATGWKIGYCVAPPELTAEFRKIHQWNVYCVNSFLHFALADYLKDPEPYLTLPSFYQKKRDFFEGAMVDSRLKPLPSEGTYFQLFEYGDISDEDDFTFCKRLTTEFGVAAIPVSVFYSSQRQGGVIRLCFAKTEDMLTEAAGRLKVGVLAK